MDWNNIIPHLEELRNRIIRAFLIYALVSVIMWFFHDYVIRFISQPVGKLYIFNVQDAFMLRLKVSLMSALFICLPYFVLEIWGFISPALYPNEKLAVGLILISTLVLFYLGAFLSIFVILPRAVVFLLSFSSGFQTIIGANQYLDFIFWSTLIFGVLFELPVAVGILARLGIINSKLLTKRRREMIVGIVIVAAVISPTVDAFSLIAMSLPLILLYEISIWVAKVVEKK
ncbi:MAG: twin-arginine translocase subunit TatC [candidate division WOR-3 bacterium]